jgi:Peptidase family M23
LLILTTIRRLAVLLLVFGVWAPAAYAWSWPVQGPVVQPFSYDEAHPYASGQHRGVDIGADAAGEPVVAPAAGTVSFAGTVPTNGKSVTIETADGYSVTLTHLGSIALSKGATVAEQDPIGTVGPSGTPEVDGPYVHLGIRLTADPNGYVDPLGLLPPASGDAATDTGTTASQPASSGAPSAVPASKPAPSAPRVATKPRAVTGSHVQPHAQEHAQKSQSRARTSRSPHRPAVRDRASDQPGSFRRPVVEPVAPRAIGLDVGHEIRSGAPAVRSRRKPPSLLLALACNWAAALFALGAALAAHRRRRRSSAQVLHLPQPAFDPRPVSRAA